MKNVSCFETVFTGVLDWYVLIINRYYFVFSIKQGYINSPRIWRLLMNNSIGNFTEWGFADQLFDYPPIFNLCKTNNVRELTISSGYQCFVNHFDFIVKTFSRPM